MRKPTMVRAWPATFMALPELRPDIGPPEQVDAGAEGDEAADDAESLASHIHGLGFGRLPPQVKEVSRRGDAAAGEEQQYADPPAFVVGSILVDRARVRVVRVPRRAAAEFNLVQHSVIVLVGALKEIVALRLRWL